MKNPILYHYFTQSFLYVFTFATETIPFVSFFIAFIFIGIINQIVAHSKKGRRTDDSIGAWKHTTFLCFSVFHTDIVFSLKDEKCIMQIYTPHDLPYIACAFFIPFKMNFTIWYVIFSYLYISAPVPKVPFD